MDLGFALPHVGPVATEPNIRKAAQEAEARRTNAAAMLAALDGGCRLQSIRPVPDASPGFLRLPVRLPFGLSGFRDPTRALYLGIAPSYPSVLGVVPQVRARLEAGCHHWPGGEELARSLFTAPTHSLLSAPERDELVQLLLEYRS